jgi:putative hydrolase
MQNALSAKEKGLLEIGISDHGFSHPAFGLRRARLDALRAECDMASESTGVRVLMGIESNFIDSNGKCDLSEKDYSKFDLFLAGAHVFVGYKDFSSLWNLGVSSPLITKMDKQASEKVKAYTTNVYIKAIETQPIDVITHLNFRVFASVAEVADCCRSYGTYVEINTKKSHMSDDEWREVASTGVNFVIGSDAHSPDRVADYSSALELIERIGIDKERVHNLGRTPSFRFASLKGERR